MQPYNTSSLNGYAAVALVLLIIVVWLAVCWWQERRRHAETERRLLEACTGVMTMNVYQELAMRTAKPQDINDAIDHALLGMCSEVGELATHWKAFRYYGKGLDRAYMVKELGDALWFLQRAATALLISLEEVADTNIRKLRLRYPGKYSDQAALSRADEHTQVENTRA